jgi:hypothetical protein
MQPRMYAIWIFVRLPLYIKNVHVVHKTKITNIKKLEATGELSLMIIAIKTIAITMQSKSKILFLYFSLNISEKFGKLEYEPTLDADEINSLPILSIIIFIFFPISSEVQYLNSTTCSLNLLRFSSYTPTTVSVVPAHSKRRCGNC